MSAMSTTLIQSYVMHGETCFFVSTINRASSAELAYGSTYAETLAWVVDVETKQRGDIVAQDEASTGSMKGHFRVCEKLAATGKFYEDGE